MIEDNPIRYPVGSEAVRGVVQLHDPRDRAETAAGITQHSPGDV